MPTEDSTAYLVGEELFYRTKGLGLDSIPAANHHYFELPLVDGQATPCVMVGRSRIRQAGGNNQSDDIVYSYLITLASASGRQNDATASSNRRNSRWHERVRQRHQSQRLGVDKPGVCWLSTNVVDGLELIPEAWRKQYLAQYLLVEVTMRERRPVFA